MLYIRRGLYISHMDCGHLIGRTYILEENYTLCKEPKKKIYDA